MADKVYLVETHEVLPVSYEARVRLTMEFLDLVAVEVDPTGWRRLARRWELGTLKHDVRAGTGKLFELTMRKLWL